jgi:hypothetical protein
VLNLHFVYDGFFSTKNADVVFANIIFHKAERNSE